MAERTPRSVAKGIRRSLSEARKTDDPLKISSAEGEASRLRVGASRRPKESPELRLLEVDEELRAGQLTPQEEAERGVERIWLKFAIGLTDTNQRKVELNDLLDRIESHNGSLLDHLQTTVKYNSDGNPVNRLSLIRDSVNQKFPLRK